MGKSNVGVKSVVAKCLSYGILIFFAILCFYFNCYTRGLFLSGNNILNILQQTAINTVIAVGMTFVIISGGIDLSVGSLVALSGVISMHVLINGFTAPNPGMPGIAHWNLMLAIPVAALVAMAVGAAAGAFSGFFITRLNVTPFIATLALMGSAKGLALVFTDGRPVSPLPVRFTDMVGGPSILLQITARFPIALLAIAIYVVLTRTRFGRRLCAIRLLSPLLLLIATGYVLFMRMHFGKPLAVALLVIAIACVVLTLTAFGRRVWSGRAAKPLFFLMAAGGYVLLRQVNYKVLEYAIPPVVPLALLVVAIGYIVLVRSGFGRRVYAIGGNQEAARLSGVNVLDTKLGVYTISGLLAGLSGFMLAARVCAGDPRSGEMYEMNAIAAVVLGGTSLMGGTGSVMGTLLGALVIGALAVGLDLSHVSAYYQMVVKGGVILLAVVLDQLKVRLSSQA